MKENKTYPMTPFDLETTDDSLRMMKLFLPYLPPSYQKMLGIYIKFQELQHTLTVLSFPIKAMHTQSLPPAPPSFFSILEEIRPYLPEQTPAALEQAAQMMQMLDLIGHMQSEENANPMDMIMSMMKPEDKEMFETYSSMFSDIGDFQKGGDTEDERMDKSPGDGEPGSSQT